MRSPTRSRTSAEEEDAAQEVGEEHADDQQPLNNGPAEGGSDVEMVEADSQDVESQGKPAIGDSIFEADGNSDCSDFEVEKDSKSLRC